MYLNSFYEYFFYYYYQNALQTSLQVLIACTRRAHNAPSRRPHSVATLRKRQTAAFLLSMFKTNAAACSSRRLHSAHLNDLHF